MDASIAHVEGASFEMPAWKTIAGHVAALFLAIIFLGAGIWKMTDPFGWSHMVEEFLVPAKWSMPFTMALCVGETLAGLLILAPRFRRWGAILSAVLLIGFMGYIGIHYSQLVGKDCSCFPLVKRTVGPAFFVGDAVMLVAALIAGWWARPLATLRSVIVLAAAVVVAGAGSYAWATTHLSGTKAPDSITADGQPYSLQHGRIFLFFYDPNCSHCDEAARGMSKLHWKSDVTIIGIPTSMPRFAPAFIRDTGLSMKTSLDLDTLKQVFPFGDPPFGIALENGRERGPVAHYNEGNEPAESLRKLGLIE